MDVARKLDAALRGNESARNIASGLLAVISQCALAFVLGLQIGKTARDQKEALPDQD